MDKMGLTSRREHQFFWYSADQDLAVKIVDLQNEKIGALCAHNRIVFGLCLVALPIPSSPPSNWKKA